MRCIGPRTRALLGLPLVGTLALFSLLTAAFADPGDSTPPGWQTFHSDQGGFTIAIPAGWTAQEGAQADGSLNSVFTGDGVSLGVTVGPSSDMIVDLPNTRCDTIAIAGTTGTMCFDTLSGSTVVSFEAAGRTFRLSGGRHLDPATLQQIVASFMPDGGPGAVTAAPIQSPAADSAPPAASDKCLIGGLGASKARILCAVP